MNPTEDWLQDDQTPAKEAAVKRSTWVSVFVNLGLTISQVVAGIVSG